MTYTDEAIIRLRTAEEQKERITHIDLSEEILYGETYRFAPRQFFEDRLELMIPEHFSPMPEKKIAEKYITVSKPQVVLTNGDYTINITLSLLKGTLRDEQVHSHLQTLQGAIREVYPATIFYDHRQLKPSEMPISYMDFKSFSLSGPIYNMMFVAAFAKQTLLGTFNCSFDHWEQWQPVVIEVLKNIREVKEAQA